MAEGGGFSAWINPLAFLEVDTYVSINTTTSYMWVFRGGEPGREVIFHRYSSTRSGDVLREVLQGFSGYLQTDAYSAYEGLEAQARLAGCFPPC